MQGIALFLTGASLYLVRKLLSFIKALQAIQYVKHLIIKAISLSSTTLAATIQGNTLSFHQKAF